MVAPEQAAEVGAMLLTESRRLDRLVADLLDLARLDAQEFRIDLARRRRSAQLCRDAGRVWSGRCAAVGVRFDLELPAGPPGRRSGPTRRGCGRCSTGCWRTRCG